MSFDDSTTQHALNYFWSFPGGTPADLNKEQGAIRYDSVGTFDVQLIVTNKCGADTAQRVDYVTVNPQPLVKVTPDSSRICRGDSLLLKSQTNISVDYEWSTGATDSMLTIQPAQTDTYHLQVTEAEGCQSSDTSIVFVQPSPQAAFTYNVNDLTVDFDNQSTNADSYQWQFGDNNSSNFLSPTHIYSHADTYHVVLKATHQNGCTDRSIKYIPVGNTGIATIPGKELLVYPNPVDRQLNVQLPIQHLSKSRLQLMNNQGKVVESWVFSPGTSEKLTLPMESYPAGMYFLKFQNEEQLWLIKLTIQH